eukprot:TRINITY_DN5819_c0_g1_i1.p1 TRINITY_DN5819_c0_g1~~TRINITY_DN5819_c0_g1_i1.p1  ORF type:complete len:301 (-),score=28.54 TRINITY_DN5819_c0_g1_i1:189-1049(-)
MVDDDGVTDGRKSSHVDGVGNASEHSGDDDGQPRVIFADGVGRILDVNGAPLDLSTESFDLSFAVVESYSAEDDLVCFELQFQLKPKVELKGELWFGLETDALTPGPVSRSLVAAGFGVIAAVGKLFFDIQWGWSWGKPASFWNTQASRASIQLALRDSYVFVCSEPGDVPPALGSSLKRHPALDKAARKRIQYTPDRTYTAVIYSCYFRAGKWCVQLPGLKPFALHDYIGSQEVYVCLRQGSKSATLGEISDSAIFEITGLHEVVNQEAFSRAIARSTATTNEGT